MVVIAALLANEIATLLEIHDMHLKDVPQARNAHYLTIVTMSDFVCIPQLYIPELSLNGKYY